MIDYINFVRPWDRWLHMRARAAAMILDMWRTVYVKSGADLPEC